ncbi:MAG: hypothetical protein ACR2PT_01940 [Endozoicomonas sp.]
MNPTDGVNNLGNVNPAVVDSTELSQQDFISAVYLERGNMLDSEVRRIVSDIETSNELLVSVNNLINKANISQYGSSNYSSPTWRVNGNNVVLDNGYGLSLQQDEEGNTLFTLADAEGNQLIYQNQTLIPVPARTTVDVMQVGIPVMNEMTMVLDDGTEITFGTATPGTPFDPQNFSGGQTDITSITITRGNQGMLITGVDGSSPTIGAPGLGGQGLDAANNDGYILLEAGGLHSWEYDGVNVSSLSRTDPNDADIQVSGYAARKLAFQNQLANEYNGGSPVLTQQEITMLSNVLKSPYADASGTGMLTPEEWGQLKTSMEAAKENLSGSNQLQTVQLQRAMSTHNQNFDAMTNSQSRIYNLLRDIVNNIK